MFLHVIKIEEAVSTNALVIEKGKNGEREGYVLVANCQTGGRGRRGRSFYSPSKSGIYMSILLRPSDHSSDLCSKITSIAAVAMCEAIEKASGKDAKIKWVNDIFVNQKKVCGILAEASLKQDNSGIDFVVLGLGVNVFTPEEGFPEDLNDVAGAIFDYNYFKTEEYIDNNGVKSETREAIKEQIINSFLEIFTMYYESNSYDKETISDNSKNDSCDYVKKYRERCFVIGRKINILYPDHVEEADVIDIDDECKLHVRYADGREENLSSGEISIRINS